jgi:glycosyltransferase 2 family protein
MAHPDPMFVQQPMVRLEPALPPKRAPRSSGPTPLAQKPGERSKKSWARFALRAGLTTLLFVFLLKSISWATLLKTLIQVHHTFLLMGLAVGVLCVVFSAYAWRSLVLAEGIEMDLARLINLYLVGIGFGHFLPTNMGGDAVKAFYVGSDSGNYPGAASAVLMSRITSFMGMLLLALPTLAIMHEHFSTGVTISFVLLSLLLLAAIASTIIVSVLLPRVSTRLVKGRSIKYRVLAKAIEIGSALSAAARKPRSLAGSAMFGVLFWVASILNYYGYGVALGLHVPLYFYMIAIPFVSMVAALPISINGFGVRESAFVYLFSTIQIPAATSLLLALLVDAQLLLFGLVGGCIYLTMSGKKPAAKP